MCSSWNGCSVRAGKRKELMITWKKQKQGERVLTKRWTEKKKRESSLNWEFLDEKKNVFKTIAVALLEHNYVCTCLILHMEAILGNAGKKKLNLPLHLLLQDQ